MPSRATLIADALRPKRKNEDAPDVFSAPDQSWADYLSSKASGAINDLQSKMRGPEQPPPPVGMGIRGEAPSLGPQEATLRPYEPTWRDQLASALMGDSHASPERARAVEGLMGSRGLGNTGMAIADFVPGGQVLGAQEAAQKGDAQGAALAMMPIPGAARGLRQAERVIAGKPEMVKIPGTGEMRAAPIQEIEQAADSYMRQAGRTGEHRIEEFPKFDEEKAKRIAQAYEEMRHAPNDPAVKRAYDAMIEETMAQYKALKDVGIEFKANPKGVDPYAASPAMGYEDLVKNGKLSFFPTEQGFGTGTAQGVADNPLLKKIGPIGDLKDATANDAFRVVHDSFGHFGPGNPFFRHPGEERAWLQHSKMYSPEARPAMTSETRGQNSWLNFGPHGEANRTASSVDTIFADQKSGIMPDWTGEPLAPTVIKRDVNGRPLERQPLAETQKPTDETINDIAKVIDQQHGIEAPAVSKSNTIFDYSPQTMAHQPDVPQFDLERYVPPRGVPERTAELADKANVRRVNKVVKQGTEMGGREWYNTDQLRQAFVGEMGAEKGQQAYSQYMDLVAATSPRSKVGENARNASYYHSLAQRGEPLPEVIPNPDSPGKMMLKEPLPAPYGHLAQVLHVQNADNVLNNGGWPVLQNPKPASFSQNLQGNQTPVTVDTHNARLWGMVDSNGKPIDKPAKTEYGFMEQLQQREAAKLGLTPAQYQASAWVGGGAETGLKSTADPFLKVFEDRVKHTAEVRGLHPEEVLRRVIRGEMPLLSVAAVPAGALAVGAAQEKR